MFGDDLNRCLHVYCHGLVVIYLHMTKALYLFFITLAFTRVADSGFVCTFMSTPKLFRNQVIVGH